MNFQSQYSNILCKICKLFPESQSHLLQCPEIAPKLNLFNLNTNTIDENFIYGNTEKQQLIVKIYTQIWKVRTEILEESELF